MKKWQYISTSARDFRPARMKSTEYIDKDGVRQARECPPGMKAHTDHSKGPHYTVWAYPWEKWLNVLGERGWEVCGTSTTGGKYPKRTAILKREITEENEDE